MAIYDDDFQSYSIGANVPFGSWKLFPSAFTAQIQAGGSGVPGTDRNLGIFLGSVILDPAVAGYQTSFTQFLAFKLSPGFTNGLQIMAFGNGPIGGPSFTLLEIRVEVDSTITIVDSTGAAILANSGDKWLQPNIWHFLQVNVTVSDILVGSTKFVQAAFELGLNGTSIISFTKTLTTVATALFTGTSAINQFILSGGNYGAYTLQGLVGVPTYPHGGSPKARINQAAAEVNELPSSGKVRVIQAAAEIDELPSTTKLRVFQMVIETDLLQKQGIRAEYIHRRHFPGD